MDDVRDAVTRIRPDLPADATEPVISRATTAGGAILTYGVSSADLSDDELSWFVDQSVMRRSASCPAWARWRASAASSARSASTWIRTAWRRWAPRPATCRASCGAPRRTCPAGTARVGGQEQNVRTIGTIASARNWRRCPSRCSDGRSIQLSAIATVPDQAAERRQLALLDGKPVMAFSVTRAWGEGVAAVADGAARRSRSCRSSTRTSASPRSTTAKLRNVRECFRSSMEMLVEGALLAILVVWFFLRDWRATLISASALPLAIIPDVLGMALLGFTMNLLTMLALTLVVGMLVDDAIVEVENIVRHLRMGKPPLQAATDAAIEIGLAVVATSLTLCAVFVPVAFMGGIPGEFFRPFAFTAAMAVLFSLLVARLLTPMMAAYWLKPHEGEVQQPRMLAPYLRAIDWCLHHRRITMAAATVLFLGSLAWARSCRRASRRPATSARRSWCCSCRRAPTCSSRWTSPTARASGWPASRTSATSSR